MYKRKIEDKLLVWKQTPNHKPLVVKAVSGNAQSLRTVMKHPEKYHVKNAIKLGDYNVGQVGGILTLPMYMGFLLREL